MRYQYNLNEIIPKGKRIDYSQEALVDWLYQISEQYFYHMLLVFWGPSDPTASARAPHRKCFIHVHVSMATELQVLSFVSFQYPSNIM